MSETIQKTSIRLMAENAVNAKFEDLSEHNVKVAKDIALDTIGCIIGGANAAGNEGLLNICRKWGGEQEAPVFVHGGRLPSGNAAMVNSISCRSNDFDAMFSNIDGKRIPSHVSGTLMPTALTLADVYGVNGKEFLTTVIAGYDIPMRVLAGGGWDFSLGLDSSASLAILGSASIAARFMGLTPDEVNNALGLSVGMMGGALQFIYDYSIAFKLGQGFTAKNGIFAAELAKEGWNGLKDALQGGKAYYYLYRRLNEPIWPEILTENLGKKFYMEESFKLYPCGIPCNPVILACADIYKKNDLRADDIREVELGLSTNATGMYYEVPFKIGPSPMVNAMYSYQYVAACVLLRGELTIKDFSTESISSGETAELIDKIRIVRDKSLDEYEGIKRIAIRVTSRDGKHYESVRDYADAINQYPTKEELLAKYWSQVNAFNVIGKGKAQKIIELVEHIENLTDMRELTELIMP